MSSSPETPKPIEKQRELYKLPKEEINWLALPAGSVEIETNLDHALRKILTPPNWHTLPADEKESVRKKVSLQIAGIEAKAVRAGFDASFARRGDKITLEGGVLYLDLKREKKAYAVKLSKETGVKAGYTEVKPEVVVKSRRAWKSLKEALEHGVVSEILTALAGGNRRAGEFENRVRLWKEIMGRGEEFHGTAEQNRAIVNYVKAELAAGRTPAVAPKPASPKEEKKVRVRVRRKKETAEERARREDSWPAKDPYLKWMREHPATPEAPDPLKEALHKATVLLGPGLDALNQKMDEYEELARRAKANYRSGADARMTRGSLWAATEKAGEVKETIFKFRREIDELAKTLGEIKTAEHERIERTKQSLMDTKASLDEQYRIAAQMEQELLQFLQKTQIPPPTV